MDLEKYYLCGIGSYNKINDFRVGIYDKESDSFGFSNGSYSPITLFKKPVGSNATYVLSYISLQEIDDVGLLYKYQQSNL